MMDKQDEALKLLKDIRHTSIMIEELQEEIDKIYTMLTSTTIKPKEINVQSSGDSDPMATKMIMILEYQEKLQNYQQELCEKKLHALKIIQQMDIEKQQIITLRYYKGYTVERIGEQVGYTYRWAWEKIHEAEQDFITIYEKST